MKKQPKKEKKRNNNLKWLLQSRPWLPVELLLCGCDTLFIGPERGHLCISFALWDLLSKEVGGLVTLHLLSAIFWFISLHSELFPFWSYCRRFCRVMIFKNYASGFLVLFSFCFPHWMTIVELKMFVLWSNIWCGFQLLRILICIWKSIVKNEYLFVNCFLMLNILV